MNINHSRTCSNGNLSTKATSPQRPLFSADSLYIDSFVDLSTMATMFCPQGGRGGLLTPISTLVRCPLSVYVHLSKT